MFCVRDSFWGIDRPDPRGNAGEKVDVFVAAVTEAFASGEAGINVAKLLGSAVAGIPPELLSLPSSRGDIPALSVLPRSLLEAGWYPMYLCDTDLTATDLRVGDVACAFAKAASGCPELTLDVPGVGLARFRAITISGFRFSPVNITVYSNTVEMVPDICANRALENVAVFREKTGDSLALAYGLVYLKGAYVSLVQAARRPGVLFRARCQGDRK